MRCTCPKTNAEVQLERLDALKAEVHDASRALVSARSNLMTCLRVAAAKIEVYSRQFESATFPILSLNEDEEDINVHLNLRVYQQAMRRSERAELCYNEVLRASGKSA